MLKRKLQVKTTLLAVLTIMGTAAHPFDGQQVPNAGSLLQQNKPISPPSATPNGTGLKIEQGNGTVAPASAPFYVGQIEITGNTKFDTATLHALVADAEGKSVTLAEFTAIADRITNYYHDHGFPLSRAVLPAQTVRGGQVKILVIEARYGKISLDNQSRAADSLLFSSLSALQSGQQIQQAELDHSLLILNDVPGVTLNATLKPGEATGTSDLEIVATTAETVSGNAALDDYGNRYTGRWRLGGTVNVFDPLHHGDVLSVNVLSTGRDMNYGRLGYDIVLNGVGTHVGAAYSALDYKLGESLSSLNGHGTADSASAWIKQPFVRTRAANFYGQLEFDAKRLKDDIDSTAIKTERHTDAVTASLFGDWRRGGSVNSWSVALTHGHLGFDNDAAQSADESTAKTQGSYAKWFASINSLQNIDDDNALYLALSAQRSNTNLDSSEKMVAGGAYTVRAYDMGELSGDAGVLGNVEWRLNLGSLNSSLTQGILFIDSEHLTINENTWVSGPNGATLSGAGVGINWFGPGMTTIKASVAKPIGARPALLASRSSARGWVELTVAF